MPSVGNFRQGMLVSIPLHFDLLPGSPSASTLHQTLAAYYGKSGAVRVAQYPAAAMKIEPEGLNQTDAMELTVFGHASLPHAVLVAKLDNLGKGASGAAVQNMKLMLNMD